MVSIIVNFCGSLDGWELTRPINYSLMNLGKLYFLNASFKVDKENKTTADTYASLDKLTKQIQESYTYFSEDWQLVIIVKYSNLLKLLPIIKDRILPKIEAYRPNRKIIVTLKTSQDKKTIYESGLEFYNSISDEINRIWMEGLDLRKFSLENPSDKLRDDLTNRLNSILVYYEEEVKRFTEKNYNRIEIQHYDEFQSELNQLKTRLKEEIESYINCRTRELPNFRPDIILKDMIDKQFGIKQYIEGLTILKININTTINTERYFAYIKLRLMLNFIATLETMEIIGLQKSMYYDFELDLDKGNLQSAYSLYQQSLNKIKRDIEQKLHEEYKIDKEYNSIDLTIYDPVGRRKEKDISQPPKLTALHTYETKYGKWKAYKNTVSETLIQNEQEVKNKLAEGNFKYRVKLKEDIKGIKLDNIDCTAEKKRINSEIQGSYKELLQRIDVSNIDTSINNLSFENYKEIWNRDITNIESGNVTKKPKLKDLSSQSLFKIGIRTERLIQIFVFALVTYILPHLLMFVKFDLFIMLDLINIGKIIALFVGIFVLATGSVFWYYKNSLKKLEDKANEAANKIDHRLKILFESEKERMKLIHKIRKFSQYYTKVENYHEKLQMKYYYYRYHLNMLELHEDSLNILIRSFPNMGNYSIEDVRTIEIDDYRKDIVENKIYSPLSYGNPCKVININFEDIYCSSSGQHLWLIDRIRYK